MSHQYVLSKEWMEKPFSLREIIRKHGRTISVLGALIVFSTFIANEGYREQLKKLIELESNARSVFELREQHVAIMHHLESLRRGFSSLQAAKRVSVGSPETEAEFELFLDEEKNALHNIELSFQNCGRLLGALDEKEQDDFNKGWDKLIKDFEARDNETVRLGQVLERRTNSLEYQQRFFLNMLAIDKLTDDTHRFSADVLQDLLTKRKLNEKRYEKLTYLFYGLYTLGWSLGLLGRIYGIESASSE